MLSLPRPHMLNGTALLCDTTLANSRRLIGGLESLHGMRARAFRVGHRFERATNGVAMLSTTTANSWSTLGMAAASTSTSPFSRARIMTTLTSAQHVSALVFGSFLVVHLAAPSVAVVASHDNATDLATKTMVSEVDVVLGHTRKPLNCDHFSQFRS